MLQQILAAAEKLVDDNAIVAAVKPLIEDVLKSFAVKDGEPAIERLISIPESTVKAICTETGADPTQALTMQATAVKAESDFMIFLSTGDVPTP